MYSTSLNKLKYIYISSTPWTTDIRRLNLKFLVAQIQIQLPNKYVASTLGLDSLPPVDLYMISENQFGRIKFDKLDFQSISNSIFTAREACKNQFLDWFLQAKNSVRWPWVFQLDFSKFKYRSTGGSFNWQFRPLLWLILCTKQYFIIVLLFYLLIDEVIYLSYCLQTVVFT